MRGRRLLACLCCVACGGEGGGDDAPPLVTTRPDVEAVDPPWGALDGGYEADVLGDALDATGAVRFGEVEAEVLGRGEGRIAVMVPAGEAGPVDVSVEVPEGDPAVLEDGFRYEAAPPAWAPAPAGALPDASPRARTPVLADLDGDGDLDLFLATRGEPSWVLANDGTGRFAPIAGGAALPAVDALDAAAADLDGDGDLDVYVAVIGADPGTGLDQILWNDGAGRLTPGTPGQAAEIDDRTTGVALGDVDGDGDIDVATANWQAVEGGAQPGLRLLVDAGGRLEDRTATSLPADATATFGVLLFDADGDGDLDLFGAADGAQPRLLFNDGAGLFSLAPPGALPEGARNSRTPAAADLDGDGDVDVALATTGTGLFFWQNDGTGRFRNASEKTISGVAGHCERVTAADSDGDGDAVLFLARWTQPDNVFLRNDGTGRLYDWRTSLAAPGDGTDAAFAHGDVDGDGDLDLVLSRDAAPPILLLQQ